MEVPRHWRLKKQRYALVGEVCPHCRAAVFPPRAVCPYCGGNAAQESQVEYELQEQPLMVVEGSLHTVHAG